MAKLTYHVVKRDGGWGYEAAGTFSETFPTHEEARAAAHRAASEQQAPGATAAIAWEDDHGHWHEELARGSDRPATDVDE
ncbi:MAG TPA: DUF2188 domain-containing protein [Hyphomicrobiales bacterium]|nr:DUF2188 domain-containing protein [Hyphomicrobiales bacterium]